MTPSSVLWLSVLCFVQVCASVQKSPTSRLSSRTKFCDPSFGNQTAANQKCGAGFYREWTGPHRGECVACSCNELSDECDEHTGNCVNCRFNAAGDHCERCKDGYYGNAANRSCRACPCPFTWNNFALACMDVGSGAVQCLCKPGYRGARCDRCAHGYYGNTAVSGGGCRRCSCNEDGGTECDALTGACITSSNSSCGDQCNDALLHDVEQLDDGLASLKRRVQNISRGSASLSSLSELNANTSETKVLAGGFRAAVRHLDPTVEQLEAELRGVRLDVNQLTAETLETVSNVENVLRRANGTKAAADEVVFEAESLLKAAQDLIKEQSSSKRGEFVVLSENEEVQMMEEAQNMVQEMRGTGCTPQRVDAGSEREAARGLLQLITDNKPPEATAAPRGVESSLSRVAELLAGAGEAVDEAKALNLKTSSLQHLQHLNAQLEGGRTRLLSGMGATKDLLQDVTNAFTLLQQMKEEGENHAAQLHGAQGELLKVLNRLLHVGARVEAVVEAGDRAEELDRSAAQIQQEFSSGTSRTHHINVGPGAYSDFTKDIEKAQIAANESRLAVDQSLKNLEDLSSRAEGLRNRSTQLNAEASGTQTDVGPKNHEKRLNKQKKKRGSMRSTLSAVRGGLQKIRGSEELKAVTDAAKAAASASNATVHKIKQRLSSISQDVEGITLSRRRGNTEESLVDASKKLKTLHASIPVLKHNITQVAALSSMAPPSANLNESIQKIKGLIEATRNLVNRLPFAATFNGKSHVELRPPKNLEDMRAFTAVDLLLNRHRVDAPGTSPRRRRRQDKHGNLFVFYLGNKNASGDYVGMAVRRNVLVGVYKLGGVVHELRAAPVTTTTRVNSSRFDRVVFRRVYQDAEVNMTQSFTSQTPVSLAPHRSLPDSTGGVLDLRAGAVVFYVGGYPEDFTPPVELRYPRYRGAMKLSYINDVPVCLFNYQHAANMDATQPFIKVAPSEVSDYYDGTGYHEVALKEPDKRRRRRIRFHIHSRESSALLLYAGNDEAFFSVGVEKGFLVLQGQQAGQQLRAKSQERISLVDQLFAVHITNRLTVQCGSQRIVTDHVPTSYRSVFIGGVPAELRMRRRVTAPALRGCVDHLTVDGERPESDRSVGVADGCPGSLLGVRSASLHSALPVDSLLVWDQTPLRVSLGFRTSARHGTLVSGSSQRSTSVRDLQLSLADGYLVLKSDNYTLKSDKRYSDGSWHHLSAVRSPTGLELSVDNVNVAPGPSLHRDPADEPAQGETFSACIANFYSRRPGQSFTPADLGSWSGTGDAVLDPCGPDPQQHAELLSAPELNPTREQKPVSRWSTISAQCRGWGPGRGEHHLFEDRSWLGYTLPPDELNYRPHFSLDFKTKSSKGLLFHVSGGGAIPLLALYVANGKIKMSLGLNRMIQHNQRSDDDRWHRVEFSVEKSSFHLLVDGFRVTDGRLASDEGSSLDLHNPVYLGGDLPSRTIRGHDVPMNSVIGCVRNFKMNDVAVGEPETSHSARPCVDWRAGMGTYFGGGHVVLDKYFPVGSDFVLAFELRPQLLTGLLVHVGSKKTGLDVFLMNNTVGVIVNGAFSVTVEPLQSLCDDKFHAVTVSKQRGVITLEVDSLSEQKAGPTTSVWDQTLHPLHIGGTTRRSRGPVSSPFVGCLRNVNINGRSVALEAGSRVVEPVSINTCPV